MPPQSGPVSSLLSCPSTQLPGDGMIGDELLGDGVTGSDWRLTV
jgi:hypothetical protein